MNNNKTTIIDIDEYYLQSFNLEIIINIINNNNHKNIKIFCNNTFYNIIFNIVKTQTIYNIYNITILLNDELNFISFRSFVNVDYSKIFHILNVTNSVVNYLSNDLSNNLPQQNKKKFIDEFLNKNY
jgi:hypothetical protein